MDIDPEIMQKIKLIIAITVFVGVVVLIIWFFFFKDEKEELKGLIEKVRAGDDKTKRVAASRLIRDFLPREQYQSEVMDVIATYMPSDWYDKALDVMYPPKKSKELAK